MSLPTLDAPIPESPHHALAVPVSDEQLWEMSARFIAAGLAANEQVSYFDDGTADAVLRRLADDQVPFEEGMRRGQLQIVPTEWTRTALLAPLDELEGVIENNIKAATDAGWVGLRFTGQMNHGLQRPGGQVLDEYDVVLDAILRDKAAYGLCFYDHARYPDELINRMRQLHAHEVAAPALYDDALLRMTSVGPGAIRVAGEIDHSNRPRLRRALDLLLDQALRSHGASHEVRLDLNSLRFLDVAAAVSLVHAAEEFPQTHRLVLTGVRPRVARVLDRCGAAFATQLSLHVRPDAPAGLMAPAPAAEEADGATSDAAEPAPAEHGTTGPDHDRRSTPSPRNGR